jgi:phosphatidylinositol alpha-mannosyltransferase
MARTATEVRHVIQRVALVSPYALSVFGGVQEQVLAMSRELTRRDVEVLVLAPDHHDHGSYESPARIARFGRRLSMPANGSRAPLTLSPRAARTARRAINEFSPDVVHYHEPFAPLLGWAALHAHEYPSVATFHRNGAGPALSLTRPLLRTLAHGIDVATAVSDAAATTIARAVGISPVVLFNGFETDRFTESLRVRDADVVLVYVGRLEERKGVKVAISAVRSHNDRGAEQWRLVIIGDGPERTRLQAQAGHDDSIIFEGALADAAKRAWLRRANALLAPSLRGESFGLTLLEAMASETAVVASDIEGYRDAAGSNATLFRAGDASDLERAVSEALRGETEQGLALAREHAQRWSMSSLVNAYFDLYSQAAGIFQQAR